MDDALELGIVGNILVIHITYRPSLQTRVIARHLRRLRFFFPALGELFTCSPNQGSYSFLTRPALSFPVEIVTRSEQRELSAHWPGGSKLRGCTKPTHLLY